MNFDRVAAHYPWMEKIFAGGLMQSCRITFLSRTKNCRHALLVGEGTGRFLVELLRSNPRIQITCVEQCESMIKQTRQRLSRERLDDSQIQFQQLDVLQWLPPKKKFDLVVTNFLLDCFRAEQLQTWISRNMVDISKTYSAASRKHKRRSHLAAGRFPRAGTRLAALARKCASVHALCVFQTYNCVVCKLAHTA